jgi:hypothetical protein
MARTSSENRQVREHGELGAVSSGGGRSGLAAQIKRKPTGLCLFGPRRFSQHLDSLVRARTSPPSGGVAPHPVSIGVFPHFCEGVKCSLLSKPPG